MDREVADQRVTDVSRKAVMVIYGHDSEANAALFDWLKAIGLDPKEWSHLVQSAGPYTGQIVETAFQRVHAVVAFFTPDEHVTAARQPEDGRRAWRLQARPNVLVETGMALITHPERTIVAVLGAPELPSDLAGRNYVQLSHTDPRPLHDLAGRLRAAGCDVDLSGDRWLDPTRFPDRSRVPVVPPEYRRPETSRQQAIARAKFLGKLRADLRRTSRYSDLGYRVAEVNAVLAKMRELAGTNMDELQVYLATIPAAFTPEYPGYLQASVHEYFKTVWNAMTDYVNDIAKI